jgi:hypothetical protein
LLAKAQRDVLYEIKNILFIS